LPLALKRPGARVNTSGIFQVPRKGGSHPNPPKERQEHRKKRSQGEREANDVGNDTMRARGGETHETRKII